MNFTRFIILNLYKIKNNLMKTVWIVCTCLVAHFCLAQVSKDKVFDTLFTSLAQKGSFNGNVLIAEKGQIVFQKSYGLAIEEQKISLNANSVFELASVSKQFTAMAVVLLQKQGKLKYEDRISKYIPTLDFYGDITIAHLLYHQGGLPDYMDLFEEKWDKSKFATNADVIQMLSTHKLEALFKPGVKYEYSNTGYALLATIIEVSSGKTYGDFLKQHIFKPLGMKHTLVYRSRFAPQRIKNYAMGYEVDSMGVKGLMDDKGKMFFTYYLDGIVGDGMVNATAGDLLKWDRALYGNTLIQDSDRALIFEPGKTSDGKPTKYAFGWMIDQLEDYGKIANHSGGWSGYVTFIERHLDTDKTIIVLQNNSSDLTTVPI